MRTSIRPKKEQSDDIADISKRKSMRVLGKMSEINQENGHIRRPNNDDVQEELKHLD